MDIKKLKPPLEKDIQNTCCEYLEFKHFFWRQNTTPIYNVALDRYRRMPKFALRGVPDIILIHEKRGTIYLEVKRPGGKLNDDQIYFQRKCEELGQEYHVITSVDDLIKLKL